MSDISWQGERKQKNTSVCTIREIRLLADYIIKSKQQSSMELDFVVKNLSRLLKMVKEEKHENRVHGSWTQNIIS